MRIPTPRRLLTPRAFAYLAVFSAVAAANMIVATTSVRADLVALVSTVLWCLSLMAVVLVTPTDELRMGWVVATWLVSALLMMATVPVFWSAVLEGRGEQIEATVTSLRDGTEKGRHLYYTLSTPDGWRIPGELGRWPGAVEGASDNPEGAVGDSVAVVVDPEGLVDPRLRDELVDAEGMWVVLVLLLGVTALLCLFAGRPPEADPVRPARRSVRRKPARARRPQARGRRPASDGSARDRR